MSKLLRKIVLIFALICFSLTSCAPANCELQMVAGGAKVCQQKLK